MYLPFIWHADKVYLQRYQNMCYDVIYHCEIEQIFPPVKRTSFCEASLLQRKQRSTIGVGRKNLLSSAFNLQIFEDGISDDIDLWNFRFWSSPDFYNFSPWLNLKKTGICSVSRIFMRKRLKEKLMPVNIRLFWVLKNQFIQCFNMGHISWNPCRIENSSIITEDWKS